MVFRAKRDVAQLSSTAPPTSAHPATLPAVTNAGTAAAPVVTHQTDLPKLDTPSRPLLGVNGTGQRKISSATNGTKPIALPPSSVPTSASPSQQPSTNADNKSSSTINKSLSASHVEQAIEAALDDIQDKLIGDIDESEEAINQTVNKHFTEEHLGSQVPKTDYFQYYNSTTVVDKNKSDEYWTQKKDYIISSILSKSHRRAIVSATI